MVSPERVVGTNYLNILNYIILMEEANIICAYISIVHAHSRCGVDSIPMSIKLLSQFTQTASSSVTFKCELCECSDLSTERDFFAHIGTHLRSNETVVCFLVALSRQIFTYILYTQKEEASSTHTDRFKSVVAFVDPVQVSDTSDNVRPGCSADVSYGEVSDRK